MCVFVCLLCTYALMPAPKITKLKIRMKIERPGTCSGQTVQDIKLLIKFKYV